MSSKQEIDDIKRELSTLSCPFTWELTDASKYYMAQRVYTNVVDDKIDEEAYLSLEKLISSLVVLYEKVLFIEMDQADIKLNQSEQLLLQLQNEHEDEDIMRVIEHIVNSTKCHYLFETNKIEQLKIILPTIIQISDFTDIELAALAGCQSIAWSLFMNFGRKKAMDLANQAIQKYSDKALWHFIFAKNVRRDRRLTSLSIPSEVEKQHFEIAYRKSPNPIFGIYLAQAYRECNVFLPFAQRKEAENLLLDIYKGILRINNNNYKILLKLALGFTRLKFNPQPELAKDCLDAIEKLEPNNSTYFHYKGIYLEKFGDVKQALVFYKKAAELYNYPAEIDYVTCGWKARLLNPLTHLQSMLIKYDKIQNYRVQELYLFIATCYYQETNWIHAIEYYLKAIEVDPESKKLTAPFYFLNFTTKGYKNGIYEFLKLKFFKIVIKCREYKQKNETFIILFNKLQNLCYLYDIDRVSNIEE